MNNSSSHLGVKLLKTFLPARLEGYSELCLWEGYAAVSQDTDAEIIGKTYSSVEMSCVAVV